MEIKRVLRAIFPEQESVGDVFTRRIFRFLKEHPSARRGKMAKVVNLAKVLNQPQVGNKPSYSAEDILHAATRSIAPVSPAKEVIF